MRTSLRKAVMAFSFLMVAATCFAQAPSPRSGVVRVKLQRDLLPAARKAPAKAAKAGQPIQIGVQSVDAALSKIKGVSMRPVFPCPANRAAEHAKYGLDQWYEISFDADVNPLEARRLLRETAGVESADARVPMKLHENPASYRVLDPSQAPALASAAMPFNDPRLPLQWHYNNDGSMNGSVAGADINLFKAWQIASGSRQVVVAVVDGGVDYTHEDLAGAMWVNQAELNGTPGVDDDGNGFVDDIYGFNFCTYAGDIYPHSHGTHVAGTVGAVNNNGIGVAGVAGGDGTSGSGVRLMSCQVFDPRSGVGDGDFAAALVYAADMGATIAQCSWGWDTDGYYEQDVLDAVRYFTRTARSDNMTGGLCIFSTGNTGTTGSFYPGCMDEVISVGSLCYDKTVAPYSNYGSWVDVTAPGGNMDFDSAQGVLSTLPDNSYGYNEGTSMASPHVSGVAALILSKYGAPTLINETVRQQIVTSVNDLYTTNPSMQGLCGSGYIDAWKALQWGDGTAPQAVSDLHAVAAQDNILLSWTIPASSDNNVNSHIIYYSDSPFTADSNSGCKTAVVDTKFNVSGDRFSYEISGLEALTTYYMAIVAVDRWSNASPMSEVISVKTNEGPAMTVSRTAMNIKTEDGVNWTSSSFDIGNTASGLLKWKASMRTFSSAVSSYSAARGLATAPYSGQLDGIPAKAPAATVGYIQDFMREDYPQSFTNASQLYAYIGDTEEGVTNSMAQLFTVDANEYPDGFNLTHIYMEGSYGKNPRIEVYRSAGTLSASTLLGYTTLNNDASPYYTDVQLNESFYFRPGESFYVVVHFTEGAKPNFPLGLGLSNGNAAASHAYMSSDLGETWTLLSEVLKGTTYEAISDRCTWDIIVKSKYPDWSQILTMTPSEGQLEGGTGEKQNVQVAHNGTNIPNGSYRARIHFDTNETNPSGKTINVNITVAGNEPKVAYNKVLQFGNVMVGQKKTITVQITNTGYGSFAGGTTFPGIYSDKISCSSDQFIPPAYLQNGVPSRSSELVDVTFAPTREGSHSGQVVIKDVQGRELVINVQGAATEPAKIKADPQTVEVGDLDVDAEDKEVSFAIKNEGNYPLQWVMPKYSSETLDEISSSSTHKFGYSFLSNIHGADKPAYTGAPALVNGTDVSAQLGDYDYFSDPVDIGFQFPFYGKTYDKLYISSLGMLTFGTYDEGTIYSPLSETAYTYLDGLGAISAYGYELGLSPASRIEYGTVDGKFVVYFKDVLATVYAEETIPVSFHIALSPSGDVEVAYHNYVPASVFQGGKNLWVGLVDPAMEDPITFTSARLSAYSAYQGSEAEEHNRWKLVTTGSQVLFNAPRPDMIKSISPTSGIVPPNQQVNVTAKVGANDAMYIGETTTNLVIQSNDVTNPTYLVAFNANVTGNLHALFEMSAESVDFGRVFRTASAQKPVSVQNKGRNYMTLQSVAVEGGKFTHNFTQPVEIAPGQSKDIMITMPTAAEGKVSDVLAVTTTEGVKKVALSGEVIGVPEVTLGYESLRKTVPYGETLAAPLSIKNSGNETLTFSVTPGQHMTYTPEVQEGTSVSYRYVSSLDDASAKRDWYDIETTGLGQQYNYTYFISKDVVAVDLPFEFPFYGKKYKKMYIYDSGFVSFTERKDEGIWPEPPVDFPQGTIYNNLVAPYWGLHTMDITASAGVFQYVNDNEAVVSFIEYGNSMNIGIDFQVVLRKDGTFTFNYKEANANATLYGLFGVAGISDPDNEGVRLPERYVNLGSSIDFFPVVECAVQPGETRTADIELCGDELAGTYSSKISLSTNVPTRPQIEVPVTLTITGDPKPVFPEDTAVEYVSEYMSTDYADELVGYYGSKWYVPLTVRNEGAAAFTIDAIDIESPKNGGQDIFCLYHYGSTTDWMGNPTTGWGKYDGSPVTVGKSLAKFAIPVNPYDNSIYAWDRPGTYDVKLTFHVGSATYPVNVKMTVTEQPTIELGCDELRITDAEDTVNEERTVTISNADGRYALKYELTVDPTGVGDESVSDGGGVAPAAHSAADRRQADPEVIAALSGSLPSAQIGGISAHDVGIADFRYDAPDMDDFPYRRALYWAALPSSTVAYNYGTTTTYGTYRSATAYTGPKDGFNISHIYMGIHPFNLDEKDVTIEIYGCDPQLGDDVLGQGTYHIGEVTSQLYQNQVVVAALDRPVYISEGQDFWVVITYPVGQEYPATLVVKTESVQSNRYMGYWDSYGWFDVATLFQASYGSLGYINTCLETTEGGSWVRLLDNEGNTSMVAAGDIAVGASKDVKLQIIPGNAPKDKENKTVLIVRSNDPKNPVINFPIYLDKNGSPAITAPRNVLAVSENSTIKFNVTVTEPEAEDFTVQATDDGDCASILSATAVGGVGTVTLDESEMKVTASGAEQGVKIEFQLAPAFETAGNYKVTLKAADAKGHNSQAKVNYCVNHVNRAPEAVAFQDLILPIGQCSQPIDLASLFNDPDGDELTFEVSANNSCVKVYRAEDAIILETVANGMAKISVKATDPFGETCVNTLRVNPDESGIGGVTVLEGVSVYPNPVLEKLFVATPVDVTCHIYDTAGALRIYEEVKADGSVRTIDMTPLSPGLYVLKLTAPSAQTTTRLLLKN